MSEIKDNAGVMIHEAVDEAFKAAMPEALKEGTLLGVGVISEWITPHGRFLIDLYTTQGGEAIMPDYMAKGYLTDSLHQYDRIRGRTNG